MTKLYYLLALATFMHLYVCQGADLKITTTHKGDCSRKSASGDAVSVHYEGTLDDGSEFDSSYKRGDPFTLTLGQGMVIKGWDQGLLDMCIGEKRTLVIPPHLAYGERGYPPVIPEQATLTFKVELIEFQDQNEDEL